MVKFYGGRTPLYNATGAGAVRMEDPRLSGTGVSRGMYNGIPQDKRVFTRSNYSTLNNNRPNTYINPNKRMSNSLLSTTNNAGAMMPSNRQPQIGQFNNKPRSKTPPNYTNNLLDYILSPSGKGMAMGLLESSGYSTKPVGMGEALAKGMARSTEFQNAADNKAFKKEQFEFNKKMQEANLDFKKESTEATNKLQESLIDIKKDTLNLEEEKFSWTKDNPKAVSTLGRLKEDYNKNIITLDEYNAGIASATGIKDTATIQTIKWLAKTNFNDDVKKATDKYFNSKTQDKGTYKRETIKSLIDNPLYDPTEAFEMSEYITNQAYAEPLPVAEGVTDLSKLEAGNYYLHPNHGLVQAKLVNGNIVAEKVATPSAMQAKN